MAEYRYSQSGGIGPDNATEEKNVMRALAPQDTRLALCVIAFITPYLFEVSFAVGNISFQFYAPLWTYVSLSTPPFRFLSVDYLIFELPFGIVKLLFIQQVYLFMIHQTPFRKLIFFGVATEMPATVLAYILSIGSSMTPLYIPVPVILLVGLFLAVRTPKKPLDWLDDKQP